MAETFVFGSDSSVVKELWEQATLVYNLPLTIGLILLCLYWIVSSVGIFDFDTDIDVELDLDADIDVEGGGGSMLNGILNFVNAAEVPLMFILTILNAFMWGIAMTTNHVLNPSDNGWLALGLFVANFIISVILTKFLTKPLAPLFKSLKDDSEKALPLVGQVGKVKSRVLDHHYGQVEIPRDKNAPALINCKLSDSDPALVRGNEVIVVKFEKTSQRYIVRSLQNLPKQSAQMKVDEQEEIQPVNLTTNN